MRQETERCGALLIFDEVITGFRLAEGGAAEHYGITPDLAAFGKVIGGGMPVGAFGGRRRVMRHLAPEGAVYQAGTLSGNPVAMAAGLTTLRILERDNGWQRLEELGQALEEAITPVLERSPAAPRLARLGSIFWLAFHASRLPRAASEIDAQAADTYSSVFGRLLDQGIALAPSAYEVGFLSLAHTEEDIGRLADALAVALDSGQDK